MRRPLPNGKTFNAILASVAVATVVAGCSAGGSTVGGGSFTPNANPAITQAPGATPSANASASTSASPGASSVPGVTAAPGASASPSSRPTATAAPTASSTFAPLPGSGSGSGSNDASFNTGVSQCRGQNYNVGQTATYIYAAGNVSNGTFNAQLNLSSFTKLRFIAPSPGPTYSPGPEPTDTSTPSPTVLAYYYVGTYTVRNSDNSVDTNGCAVFLQRADGQPLDGQSGTNASSTDIILPSNDLDTQFVSSGTVTSYSINNINGNSGSGSFTLSNGQTGTVNLTERHDFQLPIENSVQYYSKMIRRR